MGWSEDELQARIEEVIVDAYGDDEQLESFVDPEVALTLAAYRRWLRDDFG